MTGKESQRRLARELALQAVYAVEVGDREPDEAFDQLAAESKLNPRNLEFSKSLYRLLLEKTDWADAQLAELSENWEVSRMATIDRIILRLAILEMEHMVDVPLKVVINEAIELARTFSTVESSRFVNGILDNFAKRQEQQG